MTIVPDDEAILKIEERYPDASPADKWRLAQAMMLIRLSQTKLNLSGVVGSEMSPGPEMNAEAGELGTKRGTNLSPLEGR